MGVQERDAIKKYATAWSKYKAEVYFNLFIVYNNVLEEKKVESSLNGVKEISRDSDAIINESVVFPGIPVESQVLVNNGEMEFGEGLLKTESVNVDGRIKNIKYQKTRTTKEWRKWCTKEICFLPDSVIYRINPIYEKVPEMSQLLFLETSVDVVSCHDSELNNDGRVVGGGGARWTREKLFNEKDFNNF